MSTTQYDDAEVPLSAPLLKMAIKKNWVGKDSNITCPYLSNSTGEISSAIQLRIRTDNYRSLMVMCPCGFGH